MHGALISLDDSFSWQSMALALQIPTQNSHARAILEREFNTLLEVKTNAPTKQTNIFILFEISARDGATLW